MKKCINRFLFCVIFVVSMTTLVYAQNDGGNVEVLNASIKNVISTKDISRVVGSARGRVLSSAGLGISNDKDGLIGVYAETLCHESVKQIQMTIFLEVWDESIQDWEYVNDYSYSWQASDTPNRDLTDVSVSFDIAGLAKGKTYSLRGYHTAKNFDNISETMITQTGGIILE